MSNTNELSTKGKNRIEMQAGGNSSDVGFDAALREKRRLDVNDFLEKLFAVLDVGRDIKRVINPDLDYIVKFKPELLKKMEQHDIRFLTDKVTGDLLPDLYDYTEKGIGGKVRLEIKGTPTGQDLANLSNSINNLIEQQHYYALVEELRNIRSVVKRVERGQDIDRFAKVNAGRKMLLRAVAVQDDAELKRDWTLQAASLLLEARESIEIPLLDKLDSLRRMPNAGLKLWLTCLLHPERYDEQTELYQDVQEYFYYYCSSLESLAYAYTCLGQCHLVNDLLEDSRKIFNHENLDCLSSIEPLLPTGEYGDTWYKHPKEYEQKVLESYKPSMGEDDTFMVIKGQEILEVLGYVQEERTEE